MEQQAKYANMTNQEISISKMASHMMSIVLFGAGDIVALAFLILSPFRYADIGGAPLWMAISTIVTAILFTGIVAYDAKYYVIHRELARRND